MFCGLKSLDFVEASSYYCTFSSCAGGNKINLTFFSDWTFGLRQEFNNILFYKCSSNLCFPKFYLVDNLIAGLQFCWDVTDNKRIEDWQQDLGQTHKQTRFQRCKFFN